MNELIHTVFDKRGAVILFVIFLGLFFLEGKFHLRGRKENRSRRALINGVFSVQGFLVLRFLLIPCLVWVAIQNEKWRLGINYFYELPTWAEGLIAFLLLDYGNYAWHLMNHKIDLLWRFHLVHHTDIDMDVTTAIRFHFGEVLISVVSRAFVVLVAGASPILVLVYEICFEVATQFHHSNLRLPLGLEKLLNLFVVTPRMHGIHHSVVRAETDSNYSVIFSFWDRLHRTVNLHIPQVDITTGVPVYSDPQELTPIKLVKLPFTRIRKWTKKEPSRGRDNPGELSE